MIDFDIFDDINESLNASYEFFDDIDGENIIIEFDDDTEVIQEGLYEKYLHRHNYDPKTNTIHVGWQIDSNGISSEQAALQRSMDRAPTQDTSQPQTEPVEEKSQSLSVDNPTGKLKSKQTKESDEYITYNGMFFESSNEHVDDTDIRISICSELENIIKPWLEVPPEIWDIDKVGYSAPVESFPDNWLHNTETLPLIEEFLSKMKEPCQNVMNLLKDLDNKEFENVNEFVEDTSLTVRDLLDSDIFKTSDWEDKLTREHIDEINSIHEFVDQTIKAVIAWIKKIYPQYMEFNIGLRRLTSGDRSVLDE